MNSRDKVFGAYIGAAIGDAMGGPVECSHAERIRRLAGEISGFLPYNHPCSLIEAPAPGYALRTDPGAVTDDSFIRGDLTRYYTSTKPPRNPDTFARWLLEHADFSAWWQQAVEAVKRIKRGEVVPEESWRSHKQGGGVGWWTPIGILFAGDPEGAFTEAHRMCTIWKDPLEQDLLASVQAGVAVGMAEGSSTESVVDAITRYCGPLARKLLERGIDTAVKAEGQGDLIERLYKTVLIDEHPQYESQQLPAPSPFLADTDETYASVLLSEQVPLALAAFVHAEGNPSAAIPLAVQIGRDCDTTATTVGSWCGSIHGESGLPEEWVETVCTVNLPEIDLRGLAESLLEESE